MTPAPEPGALSKRSEWWPLGAVLALALVQLRGYLTGDVPFMQDVIRTDLPMRIFIHDALVEGRVPQWFPYEGLGMPFIGNAEGFFRPFTLLYLLPDVLTAMNAEIVLSYLVGAWGAWLLGRALGLSGLVSACLAVFFSFSGYSLGLQLNLPYLAPFQTLPWVLWAVQRMLTAARPVPWMLVAAIFWALVLLGGDPLLSVLLCAAILALFAARRSLARFGHLVGAGALMAGLSMAWVLPAFSLFQESVRASWGVPDATDRALHPARLPELLLGGFWPDADHESAVRHLLDGNGDLWAQSIYLGPTALALCAFGVWRRRRETLPWAIVGGAFFWTAMGSLGGLHTAVRTLLSLLDRFRYPEKFLSVGVLALAVAAAHGLAALLAEPRLKDGWARVAGVAAAAVLLTLGLAWALTGSGPGPFRPLTDEAVPWLRAGWSLGAVSGLLFLGLASALVVAARRWPAAALALPVLFWAELALPLRHANWLLSREHLTTRPRFCRAAAGAGVELGRERVMSLVRSAPSFLSAADAESWLAGRLNLLEPDTNLLCGLESVAPLNLSGNPKRVARALEVLGRERFSGLANAGLWVVELPADAPAPPGLVDRAGRFALIRPPGPVSPRAWVGAPRWVATPEEALAWVRDHRDDALRTPVLEGAARTWGEGSGTATVRSYRPEEVVLQAELSLPGAVVLDDLWFRGWRAEVDGAETEIFPANAVARAVLVPAGHHEVRFTFEMPRLAGGVRVAALTLIVMLALLLWDRRRPPGAGTAQAGGKASSVAR